MSKSIQSRPFRAVRNKKPIFSPSFLAAMETLISDDSNPVFIICPQTDLILVVNDYIRKKFGASSILNKPFSSLFNGNYSHENTTLFFRHNWYKMSMKAFEMDGRVLKKVTLSHPNEIPGSEIMKGVQNSVSMILHRFRSPLTGILGYMDLLSEWIESDKEATYLDKALTGLNHLSGMLDELESLATSPGTSEKTFFDPSELLLNIIRNRPDLSHRVILKTKNTDLIYCCYQTLYQLITILLDNALEYSMDQEGSIIIRINSPEDIEITNNGLAIPDDIVHSLFDPFVSSRSDRMGNGLAIAQTLAQKAGISLNLKTNKHDCITFKVKIPPADEVVLTKKAI